MYVAFEVLLNKIKTISSPCNFTTESIERVRKKFHRRQMVLRRTKRDVHVYVV
jgi:hypothetical protein